MLHKRTAHPPALLERVAATSGPLEAGGIGEHRIFTTGAWNANIIGQRTAGREANAFDDWMHLIWKDDSKTWEHWRWQITTDPGTYWLQNPSNVNGTAILAPGQFRGAYGIGRHRDRYQAVCQVNGKVAVYRDNDRDNQLDPQHPMEWGYYGINHHKAGEDSTQVDRWSAGCQVFARSRDFTEYLRLAKVTTSVWGPKLTYTLLGD